MRSIVTIMVVLFGVSLFCSCSSKTELEANRLYEDAKKSFENKEYDMVVLNLSKSLELMFGKKPKTQPFADGTVRSLRGFAYAELNRKTEAIDDYTAAIKQGDDYLNRLVSTEEKRNFKCEVFAVYYIARSLLYKKIGEKDLADKDKLSATILRSGMSTDEIRELFKTKGKK
ncbi:MAG: hypothetical protein NUV74_02215 [Candidatus Brocadiaceae bacterium]|nr:hypothetical protein [Candidatus Brocadiaceae bacterium]